MSLVEQVIRYMRQHTDADKNCSEEFWVTGPALERVSGVSRKTVSRWRTNEPRLSNFVAVVESMGGRVIVELPEPNKSSCKTCGRETATLVRNDHKFCGRCASRKE
jgi:hypothetical protein